MGRLPGEPEKIADDAAPHAGVGHLVAVGERLLRPPEQRVARRVADEGGSNGCAQASSRGRSANECRMTAATPHMPPEADQLAEVRLAFVLTIQDAMRLVEEARRVLKNAGEPDPLMTENDG